MCAFQPGASPPKDEVLIGEKSFTQAISEQLGEVLFIYGDTSVDGFAYEHASDGELLRKLVWFPLLDDEWTAGWVCVQGSPEDWEAALFQEKSLEQYLENERQRLEDLGQEEDITELEVEVRQVWEEKRIPTGKTFPSCDGTVALLVEASYGIKRVI